MSSQIAINIISTMITAAIQKERMEMTDPADMNTAHYPNMPESPVIFFRDFLAKSDRDGQIRFCISPEDEGYFFFILGQSECDGIFNEWENAEVIVEKSPLSVKIMKAIIYPSIEIFSYDEYAEYFRQM